MSSTEVHLTDPAHRIASASAQPTAASVVKPGVQASRAPLARAGEQAREDERQRLARRLHDDLGQRLAVLQLDMGALRQRATALGDPALTEGIGHVSQQLSQAVTVVRELADEWRPLALDDIGLSEAIDALARRSAERMGIEVTLRCDEQDPPVSVPLATALYQCAQEALRNVAQHAQATDVAVELFWDDRQLRLEVQDNGVGPPAGDLPEGAALWGLSARIGAFGGALTLDHTPGSGACLRVRVPIDAPRAKRRP